VARLLASAFPVMARINVTFEPHEVNGQPGAVLYDSQGRVIAVAGLDIADGQIQAIHSVVNPDKLGHLGPVSDVARRPSRD